MKKKQVEIELKDSVTAAVETVNRSLDILEKKLDTTKTKGEKFKDKMKEVGDDLGEAFLSFSPGEFLKGCAEEFMEAQKSAEQLSLAVSRRGGLGSDMEALQKQAEELQKKGIFGAGETLKLDQLGLQMGLTIKGVQQLTPLIEDVAAATSQSTQSVLEDVIKTANGSEKGLEKYGLRVEDTGSKTQNLGNIVSALTQKYHDANEAIATTTDAGRVAQLTNDWGDFKEQIGASLLDILHQLMPLLKSGILMLKNVAEWMGRNKTLIEGVGVALAGIWTGFKLLEGVELILGGLEVAMGLFAGGTEVATGTVTAFGIALDVTPLGIFAAALGVIATAYNAITSGATNAKEAKDKFDNEAYKVGTETATDVSKEYKKKKYKNAAEADQAKNDFETALDKKIDDTQAHLKEAQANVDKIDNSRKRSPINWDADAVSIVSQWGGQWEDYLFGDGKEEERQNQLAAVTVYQNLLNGEQAGKQQHAADFVYIPENGKPPQKTSAFEQDDTGKKAPDTITKPVEGQKIQTFNIAIGDLIKDFTISTTNLSEAPAKVREIIVQALLSAVNDSQISTAH